jgi:hypothetical protein
MSQENVEAVRAMLSAWNERRMDDFRNLHKGVNGAQASELRCSRHSR